MRTLNLIIYGLSGIVWSPKEISWLEIKSKGSY